jgi:hypothetical protein
VIVALDPGGTTGVAWLGDSTLSNLKRIHITENDHHKQLYDLLYSLRPQVVVCESFEYRKGLRDNVVLVSKEYIGVAKLYVQRFPETHLAMQTAAYGKAGFWTHDKLKRVGLYDSKFAPHAMDATCHLLQYMTFQTSNNPVVMELLEKLRD